MLAHISTSRIYQATSRKHNKGFLFPIPHNKTQETTRYMSIKRLTLPEAPAKRPFQEETSIPTIHFQVRAVSFRESILLYTMFHPNIWYFLTSNLCFSFLCFSLTKRPTSNPIIWSPLRVRPRTPLMDSTNCFLINSLGSTCGWLTRSDP